MCPVPFMKGAVGKDTHSPFDGQDVSVHPVRDTGSHDHRIKLLTHGGFPGGAVVENLPANAGDMGSSPGLGRSHMPRSDWAREPRLLGLRVWSLCFAAGGAAMASLVAQWLRICLLRQGTRVRALVWEDPTCRGAPRPVSHYY
ncbi:hypothetical protein J1605_011618 [Eschrichtius robustus]|uniref:Uncharacterized protein n=1 Tax=Eschrichtius robustus TaxID=9764 RepID=A0AB34GLR6_ESCRO|nr:hypothetical protein J1605_011618 [Eschrichtius robustus]